MVGVVDIADTRSSVCFRKSIKQVSLMGTIPQEVSLSIGCQVDGTPPPRYSCRYSAAVSAASPDLFFPWPVCSVFGLAPPLVCLLPFCFVSCVVLGQPAGHRTFCFLLLLALQALSSFVLYNGLGYCVVLCWSTSWTHHHRTDCTGKRQPCPLGFWSGPLSACLSWFTFSFRYFHHFSFYFCFRPSSYFSFLFRALWTCSWYCLVGCK